MRIKFLTICFAAISLVLSSMYTEQETATQKKYLLGKVDPSTDNTFVLIPKSYTHKSSIYLEKETFRAFQKMQADAWKEGITLNIISAFRSFDYQKMLWQMKWTGQRKVNGQNMKTHLPNEAERAKTILRYSAMPGTSRHHWGTDIDIYSLDNKKFESGKGLKIYKWLINNASKYGFCQVYSQKGNNRKTGYEEEKWHWSYMPKSKTYLSDYMNTITYEDLIGFGGDAVAEELNVIQDYVFGIDTQCK